MSSKRLPKLCRLLAAQCACPRIFHQKLELVYFVGLGDEAHCGGFGEGAGLLFWLVNIAANFYVTLAIQYLVRNLGI